MKAPLGGADSPHAQAPYHLLKGHASRAIESGSMGIGVIEGEPGYQDNNNCQEKEQGLPF
jgi:hypothetical protein